MAKIDILEGMLQNKRTLPINFFDILSGPPVYQFFTKSDLDYINYICRKFNNETRLNSINAIMKSKGFGRLGGGTNRVAYRYLDDQSFIIKVAIDRIGKEANLLEAKTQNYIKPYCAKIYNVTPDGLMQSAERGYHITRKDEFQDVAREIFFIITSKIIGRGYIAEDIGKAYFKNWALRGGFGPILIDFPYVYRGDLSKFVCKSINIETGKICNGLIDYDIAFNQICCTKCGKRYLAHDLRDENPNNNYTIERGRVPMKVSVYIGNKEITPIASSSIITDPPKSKPKKVATKTPVVRVFNGNHPDKYDREKELKKASEVKIEPEEKPETKEEEPKVETIKTNDTPICAVINISSNLKNMMTAVGKYHFTDTDEDWEYDGNGWKIIKPEQPETVESTSPVVYQEEVLQNQLPNQPQTRFSRLF